MTILYDNNRRQKILRGGRGVLVGGGGGEGGGGGGALPLVVNWEGQTPGAQGADHLTEKWGDEHIVRTASTYGTIIRASNPDSYGQMLQHKHNGGNTSSGFRQSVGAGNGWTPSNGEVWRGEIWSWVTGIGGLHGFALHSVDRQEAIGIQAANKYFTIYSATGGSWTNLGNTGNTLSTYNMAGQQWTLIQFEFDFSNNNYRLRGSIKTAGFNEEGSWVNGNISPTFDANTELNRVEAYGHAGSGGQDSGLLQFWISKGTEVAFPDGAIKTATVSPS